MCFIVKTAHNVRISLSLRHAEIKKKALDAVCVSKDSMNDSEKGFSTKFGGLWRNTLHFPKVWLLLTELSGDQSHLSRLRDRELRYLSSEFGL